MNVSNKQEIFETFRSYDKSYSFINENDQYCLVLSDKSACRFLSEFTNFKDKAGEIIDLSDVGIKELVMNYADKSNNTVPKIIELVIRNCCISYRF